MPGPHFAIDPNPRTNANHDSFVLANPTNEQIAALMHLREENPAKMKQLFGADASFSPTENRLAIK